MQPGESGKIPVKMSAGRYGGHMAKSISVVTNVPGAGGTVSLKIEGDVWQAVDVKPTSASFGRLTTDAAKDPGRVQKLAITNNMGDEAQIAVVRCSNPAFRVDTAVIEPGKRFELSVAFASAPQVGSVSGTIELSTGVKEMPTLSVPVSAYITPDVEVMPPNLTLPQDAPTPTNRQLYIQNNAESPVKVSDLQASNPDIKLALEEMQPGKKYKLNVDVPAGYKAPPGGDRISFKTDSATASQVTVMVTNATAVPTLAKPGSALPKSPTETKGHSGAMKTDKSSEGAEAQPVSPSQGAYKEPQQLNARQAKQKMSPRAIEAKPTTMPSGG